MANKLAKVTRKPKPVPVKIVGESTGSSSLIDDMKYRARDALHTLSRAEEIKRDKPLMEAVKAEATAQMKQLSNVCKK